MSQQNIMIISSVISEGGSEEVIFNLAKNLDRNKYSTYVCALESGPMRDRFIANQIDYIQPAGQHQADKIKNIIQLINRYKIKYLFCNYFHQGHLLFSSSQVKTIEIVHGPYPWLIGDRMYNHALQRCSSIICVSPSVYNFMSKNFPGFKQKMIVIENGIDNDKLKITRSKEKVKELLNLAKDSIIIGSLGRIAPEKGIERIIEAARLLNQKYANLYFILPGNYTRQPVYFEKIQGKIADYQLTNIIFPGFINQSANILQIYDIFILPSIREGLQLALLEALKMGLPVITTNVGIVSTDPAMKDGIIGYVLDDYSDQLFSAKLAHLIENKQLRLEIGRDNRRTFGPKYRSVDMVSQYENLLSQLESEGQGRLFSSLHLKEFHFKQ